MSYRMTMFQVGGMFRTRIAVHIDGAYRFTVNFHWLRCQWEDGNHWQLHLGSGTLSDAESGKVVLKHKSTWGPVSRYEYGEEQISLKTKSNHSAVARNDQELLFYLSYPCCPRDKAWCTAVVTDRIPPSVVLGAMLYAFYSD